MTAAQAAEYLGIRQETISKLIKRKVLKAKKFGPMWRIERQSIEIYKARTEGLSKHDPRRNLPSE